MERIAGYLILSILLIFTLIPPAFATVDPFSASNNKFGIHIIQATPDESSPAAQLVNSSGGDWGYVTVLIESTDRKHDKWQEFFNDLRRRHLIPLVRLATQPDNNFWKRPYEGEEEAWADFLDRLNWSTKNRYIIIYNEPNHATEWGNQVDVESYAKVLDRTITALKNKNRDFFVLNAGFDASAPSNLPRFEDQAIFMRKMNEAVPDIFERLDGWVSHSYPNPGFVGSPDRAGRGTIQSYLWELQFLRSLGVNKDLPVFITETGWKHAEGLSYDSRLPNADTVANYYQQAFENAWSSDRIVAITPFLLSYQEAPFDHFSFKKIAGGQHPDYYPMYQTIQNLPKVSGKPVQENKAQLTNGEIYSSVVSGQNYIISLTFKNTGQSIWNDPLNPTQVQLVATQGARELGIDPVQLPKGVKIEPGEDYTFKIGLRAPHAASMTSVDARQSGTFKVTLNLFVEGKQFDSENLEFTTVVKSPVILKIKGALSWKEDFTGNYILAIKGITGENFQNITLDKNGLSNEIETKYLLPDYTFDFALEKPFYFPSQIRQTVYVGVNTLDFGKLQPDILSAILNLRELWKLLPFSK